LQVWRAVGRAPKEAADALMATGPPAANQRTLKSAYKLMRPLLASLTDCQPGAAPLCPARHRAAVRCLTPLPCSPAAAAK